MNALWHDLRYAFRILLKKPSFTAVIILTLALGIGANTAIFSVVSAVVLRPLPFDRPGELAMVWETSDKAGSDQSLVAYPNFEDWKTQNSVFQDLGVLRTSSFTLTGVDVPERVRGVAVSSGFFSSLSPAISWSWASSAGSFRSPSGSGPREPPHNGRP